MSNNTEVKFNKSGFEIRTDILDMAKSFIAEEFNYKWQGWEMSVQRDEKTGMVTSTVNMPQYPTLEEILETAERMYSFVNKKSA
jgi:hypothetical protein